MKQSIYLDYNSTAPLRPEVQATMVQAMDLCGNPSSQHRDGRAARKIIEKARRNIADFVDAPAEYFIFTGSATEANNQALQCVDWDNIFMTEIEHDSIFKATVSPSPIPVTSEGLIQLGALEQKLAAHQGQKNLISVMWAHNETGVIQPIHDIVALAKKYGAAVHTDAVQAIGKIPVSFTKSGVDMMSISAHKMGGPAGVGALIVKETVPLTALVRGGGQEKNRRAGTQSIVTIAGFDAAIMNAAPLEHLRAFHDRMELGMLQLTKDKAYVFSKQADRLPNTTCITLPGINNQTQVMHFDLAGFSVSAGSACSSGRVQVSRPLMAMCRNQEIAATALRITSGWDTKESDFPLFFSCWKEYYQHHKSQQQEGSV